MGFLLDLNQSTTTRLGLEPIKNPNGNGYLYEGCIPTRVMDVKVATQNHEKGEFKDMDVPVLQIEFENVKLNLNDPDRFYTHTFKVVGTKQLQKGTTDVYEDRAINDIENDTLILWKGIKHFLETLTGSPNYRSVTSIPKEDVVKYLDLPGIAPAKERLDKYTAFFEYIAKFINGDSAEIKSQILDVDGKGLPMWIKMLPNYDKDPRRDKKFYTISRFIGQGVFEPMKVDKNGLPVGSPKIIRVKPTESLALTVTASAGAAGATSLQNLPGNIDPSVANLLK